MKYYKIVPRLRSIIGLEFFVFVTFLAICELINILIVNLIPNTTDTFLAFVYGFLEIGGSAILVGVWLIIWYVLTKRLMKNSKLESAAKK
ncbi:MAG: hypothetical protein K9W46_07910 [Candidatus Heimdallarchaeum endolithica]|uniref:Uncharacterized protein n=1 Tax=Candidatus Heimdallarchaeum endolithica TaxID=2876572 RepID=A0A9Y1FM56_9ARCH|nr:MAG: hypothetical protein K9W46_07910 [Candidatus Heimdallarchaeum endolithica]